jgi:predicted nucleotidyltransferase
MTGEFAIDVPTERLAEFARKWKVAELSLFGSILRREEFRPDSDVDVLVAFAPEAAWSLFDIVSMKDELEAIFGRKVDFVERDQVRNPFFRRSIFDTRKVVYAA